MPKVSIIMPVYNGERFLDEAIHSVQSQVFRDWELIVVDDGSTDNTAGIARSYGSALQFFRQSHQGPSSARNLGLEHATGEYVAFLDADDIWDQQFLSKTVEGLSDVGDAVVGVCTGWTCVDENGAELSFRRRIDEGHVGARQLLDHNRFPIHAAVTRTKAVLGVGGFDKGINGAEDWDLWLRLTVTGNYFVAVQDCLAQYRLHGPSNSRNPDTMRAGRLQTLEKFYRQPYLDPMFELLKPRAFGNALVQSSADLFSVGRSAEGLCDFAEAIRLCPELLEEDETHFAIACSSQPVEYKGTGRMLDLTTGEQRLLTAVQRGLQASKLENQAGYGRAYGRALSTLTRLAYAQRDLAGALRYFARALMSDISLTRRSHSILLLVKILLGLTRTSITRD